MDEQTMNNTPPGSREDGTAPPATGKKEIPSVKETILILLLTACFVFVVMTVFVIISFFHPFTIEFFLIEGLIVVPAVIYARYTGYSLKKIFRFNPVDGRTVLLAVIIGLSLIVIVNFIESWVNTLPQPDWYSGWQDEMGKQVLDTLVFDNLYEFFILTLAVVAAAGLCEEMLFRGMLQQSLERRLPAAAAVILTAFAFTVLHPLSLCPVLVLAVVLGVVGWKSDSIYPSVIIHALNNGVSLYSLNASTALRQAPEQGIDIPVYLALIAVFVFIAGMRRFLNISSPAAEGTQ